MNHPIKGVIFDLDGVIVSTDHCHYQAWKRLAEREGIYFDAQINQRLRGVSRMASLEIILEKAAKPYTQPEKEALAHDKNEAYKQLVQSLSPADILPGAMETLHQLKAQGVKVAVGSSSRNTPMILERIGLADFFDAVADGNQITRSKPDPEVFLLAAQKMHLAPDACLVVEDADAGVEAALAGGMQVLGVGSACGNPKATLRAPSLNDIQLWKVI